VVETCATEVARLEKIMAGDPGAPAFPALAEAQRRAGRPAEAERVARAGLQVQPGQVAGRVALGLALLDLGRVEEARAELARVLEAIPDHLMARAALGDALSESAPAAPHVEDESPLAQIGEGEVEAALAAARAEREAMLDAERVALAALRDVEGRESEPSDAREDADDLVSGANSPFATRTVAELLERQGDLERAASLRRSLGERAARGPDAKRRALVAELERWLERLRAGSVR
jgi:tetratricopeptide (TPR) repeat protein